MFQRSHRKSCRNHLRGSGDTLPFLFLGFLPVGRSIFLSQRQSHFYRVTASVIDEDVSFMNEDFLHEGKEKWRASLSGESEDDGSAGFSNGGTYAMSLETTKGEGDAFKLFWSDAASVLFG
mmetsp:Transcript_18073/g.37704  ORF Transcript_18073/g.37704 Transcript_18073/m.37704 type:complete len:121 (-) Transcript_18073:250-612(-)